MQRMTHLVATLLLGFAIVSCSHAPKVLNETDTVLQIREDYLRANPNGPFNERIARGEVEKGMNFLEVLAAWGLPDTRGLSQDRVIRSPSSCCCSSSWRDCSRISRISSEN